MIKKIIDTDVLVIGGGTAGVFAAIAAARTGAKTLLIDKNNILGGTITVANVNFPGLFYAWGKQIISGPCWEAIERTVKLGGAVLPPIEYHPKEFWTEQIKVNRFIYTAVLFDMCEESGVELLMNSMLSSVEEEKNGICATVTVKTGMIQIKAKNLIDATGDANAVQQAGYGVDKSEIQQPATLQNSISGYDIENVDMEQLRESFANADLPEYLTTDKLIECLKKHTLDVHIPCRDADTSSGRTQLEINAYALIIKLYAFYRSIRGLENISVDFTAEETGVRETNRIIGTHTITADEYINGEMYDDAICFAFYPIDLHVMNGIKQVFHKDNIVPKIPYRALIPKGSKHIICAGRCISSDTYANSAVRVQATCMATGQAAGCAAAIACKCELTLADISLNKLHESLLKIGAIIPNA